MKADDLTMDFTTENWDVTMKLGSNDVGFNNEKCWVQKNGRYNYDYTFELCKKK